MTGLIQDIRFGLRQLRKSLGFSSVAIVTLALGIGANTAIFSLLNAVLLRNLPVQEPEQLVLFGKGSWRGSVDSLPNRSWQLFSYPFVREFRQKNEVFSDVGAISSILFATHGRVAGRQNLEKVDAELVTGSFFHVLGVTPVLGRVLTDSDDETIGGHPVAVASYSWWQTRFGKRPDVVGKTVTIGNTVYTIIGVAPPDFFGVTVGQSPHIWIPLAMEKEISPGWNGVDKNLFQSLYVVARRKPGVSIKQANANTNLLFKQILHEYVGAQPSQQALNDIDHAQIVLTPAATGLSQLRREFSAPLTILMAVVGLVLLVACANIANLLLARATARRREIAVRMSMGAARWRLIRQLIVESALLGLGGAVLGAWLAWWAMRLLLQLVSTGSGAVPLQVSLDQTVLGFAGLIGLLTVVLFGTVPSLYATRFELTPSLKEGRGTTPGRSSNLLARGLVVAQVAASLVLLVGAGLFLRSLVNLTNVDTGFDKHNVLMTSIDASGAGYHEDPRLEAMMQQVEDRVNRLPGIQSASFAFSVFGGGWTNIIRVPGRPKSDHDPDVFHNMVGPRYLDAMGMPIVLGRGLLPQDSMASKRVAVINETLARDYFAGESPLGRSFSIASDSGEDSHQIEWQNIEVVGVVKDAKYEGLEEKQTPAAFYPHAQHPGFLYNFVARYSGDRQFASRAIARAVNAIDPNLPVDDFTTLSQAVDDSVLNHRLIAQLCTFFGLLAVLLACIGLYGLMSYGVTRRTNEFGVRLALGANRGNVVWLVLRETFVLIALGVVIGLAIVPTVSHFIVSLLFGLKPYDALSVISAIFVLSVVALLAGYFPARRAARVDPMVALRYE
ncbi:MAG TPA: ABC transporter permease [Candidatus Sulfotelmatobacter sp.]|nr:ABC transporter permease [Candidatus Sulfotelmatobacter sp.]